MSKRINEYTSIIHTTHAFLSISFNKHPILKHRIGLNPLNNPKVTCNIKKYRFTYAKDYYILGINLCQKHAVSVRYHVLLCCSHEAMHTTYHTLLNYTTPNYNSTNNLDKTFIVLNLIHHTHLTLFYKLRLCLYKCRDTWYTTSV